VRPGCGISRRRCPRRCRVTPLDGVVRGASGFESSFRIAARRSSAFRTECPQAEGRLPGDAAETLIPGRVAELRGANRKELAATMELRCADREAKLVTEGSGAVDEDPEEDVAAGAGRCGADDGQYACRSRPRYPSGNAPAGLGACDDGHDGNGVARRRVAPLPVAVRPHTYREGSPVPWMFSHEGIDAPPSK